MALATMLSSLHQHPCAVPTCLTVPRRRRLQPRLSDAARTVFTCSACPWMARRMAFAATFAIRPAVAHGQTVPQLHCSSEFSCTVVDRRCLGSWQVMLRLSRDQPVQAKAVLACGRAALSVTDHLDKVSMKHIHNFWWQLLISLMW